MARINKNLVFESFPTTHEFMRAVTSRPQNNKTRDNRGREGKNDFCGGLSWDESVDALWNGLPETCKALQSDLRKFRENGAINLGNKSVPRNYYYGSKPNVPAALAGKPKSMRQRQRQPQKIKTVRIVYDQCQNANTSAMTLKQSGTAVLCLVYALEKSGYRVKFDLLPFASQRMNECAISLINLKDFRQPLDLLKLSFPITHPAMFRRFGFTWLETVENLGPFYDGHGHHIDRDTMIARLTEAKVLDTNAYLIQIDDCENANFDVRTIAKNLGISL